MELITAQLRRTLLENGERLQCDKDFDPFPLVKLFTPDAACTWLIAWAEEREDDLILWGLGDLGLGCPELGPVLLSELLELRGQLQLPVERDRRFAGDRCLSDYCAEALALGAIRA